MKFSSILFLRKRMLLFKVVLLLIVPWLLVSLLYATRETRNTSVKYKESEERKPLMTTSPTTVEIKSEATTNMSYGTTQVDWLGRIAGIQGLEFSEVEESDNAPGELGKPVVLPKNITQDTKAAVAEGWKKNAFNQYVSDLISIRRKLPDLRDEWCKEPERYFNDLPQTSVVICFHNEAWSVLLRTVHSVLDRSPLHLIKEIILVDDFSDMPHLMQQLNDYMASLAKVKIIRTTAREGFTRAKLLGLRYVTAPVLIYLNSQCECTEGWLEPLLDRIVRDKMTIACPVIDVINATTFEYRHQGSTLVGGFDWDLQFNWHAVPLGESSRHQYPAEALWSPTMSDGPFAVDKEFFKRLGAYDSDFDDSGGENLELSFKSWMCGGTIEIVPCSHVGRISKKRAQSKRKTEVKVMKKNYVRIAEVWMDKYAKYYYQEVGYDKGDFGNISSRVALREKLGCKSFSWYLKNIYPELFIPDEAISRGEFWMYSRAGEIRQEGKCLDYFGHEVMLVSCHGSKGNQLWAYDAETKHLEHVCTQTCLAISRDQDKITMETCNAVLKDKRQMWILENFDEEKFDPEYAWQYL